MVMNGDKLPLCTNNYHSALFSSTNSVTLFLFLPNSSHYLFSAMEDGEWIMVQGPPQKDLWNPSIANAADDEPSRPLKVTFSGPAKYWTDATPIGNGRLGAMIWGGIQSEVLQLNGKNTHFLLSVPILKTFSIVVIVYFDPKYMLGGGGSNTRV